MRPNHLPIIGIVGGIGSGKSVVASVFREEGCVVSDSDALAHASLCDPVVRDALVSWWGSEILNADGTVNRKSVGRIVFANAEERRRLEALVHPWIERERNRAFAAAPHGTKACVIDAPLLLEAGLRGACDLVVFVDAPLESRLERIRVRGWDDAELARRESAQWDLERKREASDVSIKNDGDVASLRPRIREILASCEPA